MNKYTFVVLASQKEDFLERLQDLGMVDVTISVWEPSEGERDLMAQIERRSEAVEYLKGLRAAGDVPESVSGGVSGDVSGAAAGGASGDASGGIPGSVSGSYGVEPYGTGAEAFEKYTAARREIALTEAEIAKYEKQAEEVRPWGDYDPDKLRELAEHGVSLEFLLETAGIETPGGGQGGSVPRIPEESPAQIEAHLGRLNSDLRERERVLKRAVATLPDMEAEIYGLKDRLQFTRTTRSGEAAADGSLIVMEAWARDRQAAEVDAVLEDYPDVLYIKERPSPDDETPVELKNSRVATPFEYIGNLYGMPRYGTMDLTRWFAPFYTFFFGFCLGDAGYGLILFALGLYLALKGKDTMKSIGTLCMWFGGAAIVFGFMCGSFFGIPLPSIPMFARYKDLFLDSDNLFSLAIAAGVVQILFGMILKVVTLARAFGIRYALSTIGWIMVLAMILPTLLSMFGLTVPNFPKPVMLVCLAVGGFLMLFMNNPGKNVFVNFGGGLWNTYNDLTGFLSDFLSYIRLFAIGMSGGILAQVFNSLAMDMSGDIPVVKQLIAIVILLIGHGLTMFMSTLSSVVHPLRLTFVEFYKNAGFESATRIFSPLKRTKN